MIKLSYVLIFKKDTVLFCFIYRVFTPLFSCTIVHSLNQLRSQPLLFLTGFATVHVNCTLIGVGVRRSTEQHWSFQSSFTFFGVTQRWSFFSPLDRIRRKFQLIVFSFRFPFNFASFVISLSPFFDLVHCNFPFQFSPNVYNNSDELLFKLNAVEFCTVVDTSRSPVHNTPRPLHWLRARAIMGQRGNLRALAGICEFH